MNLHIYTIEDGERPKIEKRKGGKGRFIEKDDVQYRVNTLPLVSIIIPAYQAEKTICRCINSVRNQTYKNIEIVIIDDGSTDKTREKIKEIQSDSRIRLYSQANGGVGSARNNGLARAMGEYIMFVDADDTINNDCIMRMLDVEDADIIVSGINSVGYKDMFYELEEGISYNISTIGKDLGELYRNRFFNSVCGKLYKRKSILKIHFPVDNRIGEDLLFNFQAFQEAENFRILKYNGYDYIPNVVSATHCYNSNDFRDQITIWESANRFLSATEDQTISDSVNITFIVNFIDIIINLITNETNKMIEQEMNKFIGNKTLNELLNQYSVSELNTDKKRQVVYILYKAKNLFGLRIIGILNRERNKIRRLKDS